MEKLLEIVAQLTQSAYFVIQPFILDKSGGHQNDTVGVESSVVWPVQVVFLEEFFHY